MNVLTFKDGKEKRETFSNTTWEKNLEFPPQKVLTVFAAHLLNYVYYFSFH